MDDDAKAITIANFSAFQKIIFPIISNKMATMDNPRDKFYVQWQQVQSGPNAVTENSTFRNVTKAFNVQDLQAYCTFIESCPKINEYVTFCTDLKSKTGFHVKVHKDIEPGTCLTESIGELLTDDVMSKSGKSTKLNGNEEDPTNLETETLTTLSGDNEQGATNVDMEPDNVFEICYGKMLQTFWPSITAFIESHPEHDHSKQWKNWINSGLNYAMDLAHFKMLLGTESLDQIFLFLRDSPAINQDFELVWNHKINYRTRH